MSSEPASLASTATVAHPGHRPRRRVRAFRLAVTGGPEVVVRGPIARVGREVGNDLVVPDSAVSRAHLEIRADGHGYRLQDLSSHNGTFVDGVRANDVYLPDGSTIRLGRSEVRFEVVSQHTEIEASDEDRFGALLGGSLPMRELYTVIDRFADSMASVLITGETGTGKELVAQELHRRSARSEAPFVVVDCAAVSPALIETELFGHVAGAFSGADRDKDGLVHLASGGTLFLDEVGELPLDVQPKLLRVLQEREVRRVGATEVEAVDVRVLAATHRVLSREMNAGAFRSDLYYRLAVLQIETPPLREREGDLPLLVRAFAEAEGGAPAVAAVDAMDEQAWRQLERRPWRGNVRQLRAWVTRALVLGLGEPELGPPPDPPAFDVDLAVPFTAQKASLVASFERAYLEGQLARHEANISAAARASGLERMHFKRLLKKHR